jgi:hypothetical protein
MALIAFGVVRFRQADAGAGGYAHPFPRGRPYELTKRQTHFMRGVAGFNLAGVVFELAWHFWTLIFR